MELGAGAVTAAAERGLRKENGIAFDIAALREQYRLRDRLTEKAFRAAGGASGASGGPAVPAVPSQIKHHFVPSTSYDNCYLMTQAYTV